MRQTARSRPSLIEMHDFSQLLEESIERPFSGWNFSYDGRISSTFPWDFASIVGSHARHSPNMLDMGTGGGEWLSRLPFRPRSTKATESWEANVPVARKRLSSLGIEVIQVESAPDNVDQDSRSGGGLLPFPDGSFHLVTNRHEAFVATEVERILALGGRFLTQQVESGFSDNFRRLLGVPIQPISIRPWALELSLIQIRKAGLRVEASGEGSEIISFADVGALAWYLKSFPRLFPDFSAEIFRAPLHRLHLLIEREGPLTVHQRLFWLDSRKPLPSATSS